MKNTKYILVTGGEGYIGKSICNYLLIKKKKIISIDNLSNSKRNNFNKDILFYKIDIKNKKKLKKLFAIYNFETIIHLAAKTDARESNIEKKKYYLNNFLYAKYLIKLMKEFKTKYFIFASSAAVYGSYKTFFYEHDKKKPINYYGKYKMLFEDYLLKSKILHASLRFFNICGSNIRLKAGQTNNTGVIKKLCNAVYNNKYFHIYGKNFLTKDGYSVRDYLHINDLNNIIYKSIIYLKKNKKNLIINCGSGQGTSVKDLINYYPNKKIKIMIKRKIKGDPSAVIAKNKLLKKLLNYQPKYSSIQNIIKSSINWEKYINKSHLY